MTASPEIRPQEGNPLSASDILANARQLAEEIRERDLAAEYDRLRHLPPELFEKVRDSGILRMNMPRIWGGPEMNPMEQVEVIEALALGDASLAWCAFIWCDSGIYSGYLDDAVGREMYPRLDMATSGWVYPIGRAQKVDGGYRMSGRWMFGSGCNHCDWLVAGCNVYDGDEPVIDPRTEKPEWRVLMATPDEYEILDTWFTTGLRGTGSNDYRTEDVFVPHERSFSFFDTPKRKGAIWRRPDHFLRKMAGVPLGVAADALERAREILAGKEDRMQGIPYRDLGRVRSAIGEAHTLLASARSYVFQSLEAQWRKLEQGDELTVEERVNAWAARAHAFQACRSVVARLYDTIGGSAIYTNKSPFDRHLRDLQTACQHVVGQQKSIEAAGAVLLGCPSDHPML